MSDVERQTWGYPTWFKCLCISAAIGYPILLAFSGIGGWRGVIAWGSATLLILSPLEALLRSVELTKTHVIAKDFLRRATAIPLDHIKEIRLTSDPRLYIEAESGDVIIVPQLLGKREEIVQALERRLAARRVMVRTEGA